MNTRPNVFAISRSIWDDPDFADGEFSEREAWTWLIGAAAWKERRVRGSTGGVTLQRGEFSFAVRFLAEKFHWSKDRVQRFMTKLRKRDMLKDADRDGCKVYFIKNYNRFQVVGAPERDTDRDSERSDIATASRQHRDKEETGKQDKQEIEESPALRLDSDPKPVVPPKLKPKPAPKGEPPDFAEWYAAYPLKAARPSAVKAYIRARSRASPEQLLDGARRYAVARQGEAPNYTKHPATWLNNDCWLDKTEISNGTSSPNHRKNGASNGSFAATLARSIDEDLAGHDADGAGEIVTPTHGRRDSPIDREGATDLWPEPD